MRWQSLRTLFLPTCILLALGIELCAADQPDMVFVLIGQSNMAGRAAMTEADNEVIANVLLLNGDNHWEPAKHPLNRYASHRKQLAMQRINLGEGFARKILEHFPDKTIGLIVNARGGSSIEQWAKGEALYDSTIQRYDQSGRPEIAAVLWHQGESNARDPDYLDKLTELVGNLRKDFKSPSLPIVAGQVIRNSPVNALIANLPAKVPSTAYVKSTGLKAFDGVHFDRDSQFLLGQRYAEAVVKILKKQ